jgi:hypothetical protein
LVAVRGKFIRCTSPVAETGKKPIAAGFLAKSARLFPELRLPEPCDNLEKNSVRPSLNLLSSLVLYGMRYVHCVKSGRLSAETCGKRA